MPLSHFLMGTFQKTKAPENFRQQDMLCMKSTAEPSPSGAVFMPVNSEKSHGSVPLLSLALLNLQWLRPVLKLGGPGGGHCGV